VSAFMVCAPAAADDVLTWAPTGALFGFLQFSPSPSNMAAPAPNPAAAAAALAAAPANAAQVSSGARCSARARSLGSPRLLFFSSATTRAEVLQCSLA
jgi:hypothetical protein